jgi:hypothetical protein
VLILQPVTYARGSDAELLVAATALTSMAMLSVREEDDETQMS